MQKRSLRFAVFERIWYPFERLEVSVQKKLSPVQTTWAICLGKIVIHLKKIVIRSNSMRYPFEKIVIRSKGSSYPFEKEFVDCSSH